VQGNFFADSVSRQSSEPRQALGSNRGRIILIEENAARVRHETMSRVNNPEEREREEWRVAHAAVEHAEVRDRNKVRIKTKINKRDVQVRDYYPAHDPVERKEFKYYCPICLRYFNNILVTSCCDNYICRFCIGDLARKAKTDINFRILCSHCCVDDYKLVDVDP